MEYILLLILSVANPLGGEVPADMEFMSQRTFSTIGDCTDQGELFAAADSTISYVCVPVRREPGMVDSRVMFSPATHRLRF